MEENETPNNFKWKELYSVAEAEFILGPISQHGIDHWKAVEKNSIMLVEGSVASTKFNRFQLIKFKCHKINSIENQYLSYLSDSIFLKEKQKNIQMRQNPKCS